MGYQQQWVNSRVTDIKQIAHDKIGGISRGACYANLPFDNSKGDNWHTVFQYVSNATADRHEEVLKFLQQYFKFEYIRDQAVVATLKKSADRGQGFLFTFNDKDFVTRKHRLFFLTFARGCHEHPSLYMGWDMSKGWEDLWERHKLWEKVAKYEFDFTAEPGDGHGLVNRYLMEKMRDCPSLTTILAELYKGWGGAFQHLTRDIMKGNS